MSEHRHCKCGNHTNGYICIECNDRFERHEEHHKHGGDKVQPMCERCEKAESECKCA